MHRAVGGGIFRSGKQCRERWNNYLDPKIKKSFILSMFNFS